MAIVVHRNDILQINSADDCLNYLDFVYVSAWDPFTIHTQVRITNRLGLPSDVAAYDVGLLSFGRVGNPIVNLLVLMTDGNFAVIAVPKVNIAFRT